MKPFVYKGLRKNVNRSEWVSSDEIKQSYSQIRLLAVENDTYAWVPIEDGTLMQRKRSKRHAREKNIRKGPYRV